MIFTDGFQIETRTCTLRSLQIAVQQPVSVGGRFIELAARWKNETLLKSYTGDIVLNDAYQRILAMGPVVVPYIFAQLQSEGDRPQYWFWALERLTDADPVPKEDRGSAKKMRLHWLGWATENGYVA